MKKTLLMSMLIAMVICIFVITVGAETVIPEWTEAQAISEITAKEGFDTTSRVLLSNGNGTYSTYYSYYVLKCDDTVFSGKSEFDFSALKAATGNEYTIASVVRLEVPHGFESLCDRALRSSEGFTSLLTCKIPEGVTELGAYTFYGHTSLLELELPNSLTSLGEAFAREATSLKKVSIGANTEITENAFMKCTALETVILAEGITTIGARAFQNTTSLKSIKLPESLISIGEIAFFGSGLEEITVPENVTVIGQKAFESCQELTKAVVKCSIIGERMFYNTKKLGCLVVSDSLSTIGINGIYSVKNPFLTIYTGEDASKLGTMLAYDRFTNANHVSYEQYLTDLANGVTYTKSTIVYGANECFALYNNVHTYDNESCVAVCTRCGDKKVPNANEHITEAVLSYENGFIAKGTKLTRCTADGCGYEVTEEIDAIFVLVGFSNKLGGNEMCVGYKINNEALNDYKEKGNILEYGAVAYIPEENETEISPIGNDLTAKKENTIVASLSSGYSGFDFKITGFEEKHDGLSLVMCMYVFNGESVEYVNVENQEVSQSEYAKAVQYLYSEE